ncbi:winged helix-turn-helix domain-containing protein [Pollutibacter soli]|uniref:winged helix-turn-helix domain-containing protein n=1 Tax=Pollutibacter soli TaxID=3034157 RepID=UPI003013B62E
MKRRWFILIVPCALFLFFAVRGSDKIDASYSDQKELNMLRNIGHMVLLSNRDSVSRVLPVKIQKPGVYRISFENALALVPDSLVNIMKRNFDFRSEWLIEVHENRSDEIVYSFSLNKDSAKEVIACRGRNLPENQYSILLRVAPAQSGNLFLWIPLTALAVIGVGAVFVIRKRKSQPQIIEPPIKDDGAIPVGRFRFYADLQQLQLDDEVIELTGKENHILSILIKSPNEVIDRARIQKEVWEDEGVVVTRSLDMFISKLRKKLQGDPAVNIVNVHGKGYRLEIA